MSAPMKPLASQWASYQQFVLPVKASDVQREECKRAFYAGAGAMFKLMTGVVTQSQSTEDGMRALGALGEECTLYARSVGKGES